MLTLNEEIINVIKNTYGKKKYIENPTCYFYNLKTIDENISRLKDNLPKQVDLYYAMKANNNKKIMERITKNDYVNGIEIASYGELLQALCYKSGDKILFTGPGKTEYELENSIKNKVKYINLESITEAVRIDRLAQKLGVNKVNVLIRININYSITDAVEHMGGCSTKMGIDENECFESIKYISGLKHINIKGIHVFAASGVLNYRSLIKSNEYIFNLVLRLEKEKINVDVIDFGGGLGIDYTTMGRVFDIASYGQELKKLIDKYHFNDKKIIMELGTYLVGNAGFYTAKIIDIKKIKNKKHIIIAGGVNHMGLPLEMHRRHPVVIVSGNKEKIYDGQVSVNKEKVDISGPLCMNSDKLSWNTFIDKASIGDIVVFLQSGAYCYGEGMHDFLSHFYPDEIIIDQ